LIDYLLNGAQALGFSDNKEKKELVEIEAPQGERYLNIFRTQI